MTIKKRGPSLYEVLKDTLRRQEQERQRQAAKAPPPEVDEDDSGDEESEMETGPEPEAVEEPEVEADPEPDLEPDPVPEPPSPPAVEAAAPEPRRTKGLKEIGDRTLVLTYNSAAFVSLVLVTAVFAAYSAGLSRGRGELEVLEVPVRQPDEPITVPPPPNPPPQPTAEWRIAVYAWKFDPNDPSRVLRRQLERAGFTELLAREETTSRGTRVIVLYCGRHADRRSAEADFLFRRLQGQSYQGRSLAEQVRWVRF